MLHSSAIQIERTRRGSHPALLLGAALWISVSISLNLSAQESPPPAPIEDMPREALSQDEVEVLTRGPVHEAFAEPLANDPDAGLIVPKKPPEDIAEVAPDFKPEGNDVIWIPGYWAWDDDRDNFLWVSGVWRKIPPGLRWIPGYWDDVEGGWQWTSGLWVPDQQEELAYRVAPPDSLETGPTSPAPNDSFFWVPGCWMWHDAGYRWRPGYWHPYQENWVWVPSHWVWTPNGCLFIAGYWDYRVSTRGQLFAPVYFRNTAWRRTHYYSPWCAIESTPLLVHFWVRPQYSHYYFGDYYGPRYATMGLSPWSTWQTSHRGNWDPLMTHYNVHYQHQNHFNYAARMSHWHSHYDSHVDDRPRRTFHDQQQFAHQLGRNPSHIGQQSLLGVTLAVAAAAAVSKNDRSTAFRPVTQDHKQLQFRESNQLRDLTRERAKSEKFAKTDRDRGEKKDFGKGGLNPDLKGKLTDGAKVDPPNTGKEKPVEIGKSLDATAKRNDPQPTPRVGSLKLPKPTMTTGKLAAEAPKVPTTVAVPAVIDHKDLPKVERPRNDRNRPGQTLGQPQPDPRSKPQDPKSTPRVDAPSRPPVDPSKVVPKVELPKVQPKVEPPKVQPKIELPKVQPKVEPPKVQPKVEPPKVQPKIEPPKVQPKVEPPKVQPKVEPPKVQPRVEPPKAPPRVERPKAPKVEPPKRVDPPKKDDDKNPKRGGK